MTLSKITFLQGIAIFLLMIAVIIFIITLCFLAIFLQNFTIPPQDCSGGIPIVILGTVEESGEIPIENAQIVVKGTDNNYRTFTRTLKSNHEGHFGSDEVLILSPCFYRITFEASAEGFQGGTFEKNLLEDNEISFSETHWIEIEITLERQ